MRRVLLADDSLAARKSLQEILEAAGVEVVAVGSGDLALSRIAEVQPDLVLLDVSMPGRNGYEVCEAIRDLDGFGSLPVVLLTSDFEHFDEEAARAAGSSGHLMKPLDARSVVRLHELYGSAESSSIDAPEPDAKPDSVALDLDEPDSVQPVVPGPDDFTTLTMKPPPDAIAVESPRAPTSSRAVAPATGGGVDVPIPDRVVDLPLDDPAPLRLQSTAKTRQHLGASITDEEVLRYMTGSTHEVRRIDFEALYLASTWCPACQAVLVSGDMFCISCGASLLMTSEEAETSAQGYADGPECPDCRKQISASDIICIECGSVVG